MVFIWLYMNYHTISPAAATIVYTIKKCLGWIRLWKRLIVRIVLNCLFHMDGTTIPDDNVVAVLHAGSVLLHISFDKVFNVAT